MSAHTPAKPTKTPISFSRHARDRAARRNIVPDALDYVLTHGRLVQRTGVTFYFLGKRDLPAADRHASWASHLIGTVVLVASDGGIITVYRNCRALHTIQCKKKYRLPPLCFGDECPEPSIEHDSPHLTQQTA